MLSTMESVDRNDPDAARAALDHVHAARAALADLAPAPWWYHVSLGLAVGLVFASIDIGGSMVPSGVIVGGAVLPVAWTLSVARSRGVSVNRSLRGAASRQLNGLYAIVLLALGTVGLVLKLAVDVPGAMSVAGLLPLAFTIDVSRRNDEDLRRDLVGRA
ncbi:MULTISPECIES: hypothetical protein [unclassified Streptomyces]|uniref:hypothetical protein n=1 Tax=unclassified Streptomyces TaxID=2593676 RepID=UPI00035C1A7A|nr:MULTISPECIES: hypothetical protein [unclassified Streptomyces]MYQ77595.1 hypothetical protein [Streptomyces sp. SID4923]